MKHNQKRNILPRDFFTRVASFINLSFQFKTRCSLEECAERLENLERINGDNDWNSWDIKRKTRSSVKSFVTLFTETHRIDDHKYSYEIRRDIGIQYKIKFTGTITQDGEYTLVTGKASISQFFIFYLAGFILFLIVVFWNYLITDVLFSLLLTCVLFVVWLINREAQKYLKNLIVETLS